MSETFKKSAFQHLLILLIFTAAALLYSYPIFQGKQLAAGDSVHWRAMSEEARAWSEKTGENPLWSNSMFGGMPTYTHYTKGKANIFLPVQWKLMEMLPVPAFFFLLAMICFYILMCTWKVNRWIGLVAAVAYAFASYNLQIIAAGHNTKMLNIGYLPLALAGMHAIYQKRYLPGAGMALLAITMMVSNMMYQIDYYLGIIMVFFAGGYFLLALREKKIKDFIISSLVMLGVGILSVGPSLDLFLVNKEYAKYTMRGGQSELTLGKKEKKTSGGLDKDYAFQWSQNVGETFTLLVPNLFGGGSQTDVGTGSKTYETLTSLGVGEQNAEQFSKYADTYWGSPVPFLSGPFYFGVIIVLLFTLGLFLIRSPMKWFMVAVSVLGIMMSWGKHFPALNYFLFDHLPLFNNFRTPSMVMVIPGVMMCLLAFWGMHEFFMGKQEAAERLRALKKSLLIVGGLCVLLGLGGSMFLSFRGENDDQVKSRLAQQLGNEQAATQLYDALVKDRSTIAMKDGVRSVLFVLLAGGVLWLYHKKKLKANLAIAGVGLLISVDLLGIGMRYLTEDNYISKEDFEAQFNPRAVDLELKKDRDPYYRVYDITKDPYNEAMQAFHNKCVGGYHPAKMEMYQDLIDQHLSRGKMNAQVLNMLNTKYIIFNGANHQPAIQPNPQACGNAWFVGDVHVVANADDEMNGMKAENFADTSSLPNPWRAKETALVQKKFWNQSATHFDRDSSSKVQLTEYGLNSLKFTSSNTKDGFAVFSDIYYPAGWKAYVDGKETNIVKTNYLLRGLYLPAGNHKIEFIFHPETYFKWNKVSLVSSLLILLLLISGLGLNLKQSWNETPEALNE